jgi:hypothetical protein
LLAELVAAGADVNCPDYVAQARVRLAARVPLTCVLVPVREGTTQPL